MPHVPSTGRTRRTHRRVARRTHSHSGYLPGITGWEETFEQAAIDGVPASPVTYPENSIGPAALDHTPPAIPTGLTLSSDNFQGPDGKYIVRLGVTLTPPSDTDYFGSFIEITRENDNDPEAPSPLWGIGSLEVMLGKEQTKLFIEGVAGNTQYWARARSVDVQNNKSDYTSVQTIVTVPDTDAPSVPVGLQAVGGFRGVAVSWNPATETDLRNYQLRYGTANPPTSGTVINVRGSVVWIPGLEPGVPLYFQIQATDESGNTSGYSTDVVTATPTQVGTADIAANSITAASGIIGDLSADVITAGTLKLDPANYADALEVWDAGVKLAEWSPSLGIRIYDALDDSNYAVFDDGYLRFYKQGVLRAEIGPNGIVADSIRLGVLSGAHNVLLNSSFEMAAFVAAATSVTFTDNTGTPGWKAANRTTAPENMTEGTDLTPTTMTF